MNYRVPKKLLLLVVVFKLDHHISGAMSNVTQIIKICVLEQKKVTKIDVCQKKNSFEMDLGSTVLA